MADLTNAEKRKLERVFGMSSGYVLDFSNRTFSEFIEDHVHRNIYDELYAYGIGLESESFQAFLGG